MSSSRGQKKQEPKKIREPKLKDADGRFSEAQNLRAIKKPQAKQAAQERVKAENKQSSVDPRRKKGLAGAKKSSPKKAQPVAKASTGRKPAPQKPAPRKPAEKKAAAEKAAEKKAAPQKTAAKKATVQKPAVNQSATKKPAEKKTAAEKQRHNKPSENKPSEQKSAAQKPSLNKPRESKQIQFKEQAKKEIKHAKEEQLSNPEELIKSIDKAENEAPINLKALLDPRVRRLIVLCAVIMMLILFFTLPSFRIKKFTSTPLRFVSEGQLLQESGLKYNQHFLTRLLNPDFAKTLRGRYVKAEARLKAKFPQIRDVEIKLHFPNTIHFTVLERLPIAAIEIPDGIVLMDRDGIVLGLKNTIPQGVPVIAGLEVRQAKIGDKLEVDLERELNRALSMLSALIEADAASAGELHLMPLLEELRPGAYQRVVIKLRLPANNKSLNLSCAQNDYLTKHFVWLRKVIAAGVFDDRVPGTLDLSGRYQIFKPLDKRGEKEVYQWDGIPIDPAPQAPVMPVEEEPLESEWSEDAWTGEYGDEITYGDDLGYSE